MAAWSTRRRCIDVIMKLARLSKRTSTRSIIIQAALLLLVVGCGAWLVNNVQVNLRNRGLTAGYDFLSNQAGFDISESLLPYEGTDTYAWAFLAGALNTLCAAIPALMLATFVGFASGIASISRHPLLRAVATVYVDVVRNIPLLVQLLLWYFMITSLLPPTDAPWTLGPIFLSNAGLILPTWVDGAISLPVRSAYGVDGGMSLSGEWLTMVLGLTFYSGAYMSELVRAGLQSVDKGQWEAARALSIKRSQTLRHIVIPQSLRVVVPPYINLAANTVKNSSLAIAVGYPDLVSLATTSMNQTGRAIECVSIIAALYLAINLITSLLFNVYNRRVAIRER